MGRQNNGEAQTHFLEGCNQLSHWIQQIAGGLDILGGLGRELAGETGREQWEYVITVLFYNKKQLLFTSQGTIWAKRHL